MTVLLVDDDEDQLGVRHMLLEHYGFQPVCACNAETALNLARECGPEIAVVDLRVPTEQHGWSLIASLRETLPQLSIVVLSGVARDRFNSAQQGLVDDWITKGSGPGALIGTLTRLAARLAL